jgi:hypothetical protein
MTESNLITFEYGAMSSRFSCKAENKLTAYVAICIHYDAQNHLVMLYEPAEIVKNDVWTDFSGNVSARLDEIFGGEGSFDKYVDEHIEEIRACYDTIKLLI